MADFAPQVRRSLHQAGWLLYRQGKGDHEIWANPTNGRKVIVDSKILSRHTANAILKQAGLRKQF